MALRANVLAKGFSGIRVETLDALIALLNRARPPARAVARIGRRQRRPRAAGASRAGADRRRRSLDDQTDGERSGTRLRARSHRRRGGAEARRAGADPLGPKEGLALINGTQPSTAVLALALAGAEQVARAADIAAALSIDALRGSIHPFEARIHEARPFRGQPTSAANIERADARQRHQPVARALRQGAGRLLAALRGAGARRRARGAALRARHGARSKPTAPPTTRWCSPTPATSCRAATFTARRSPSPPTCSPPRSSRSRRSASGGPIGWSIRRSAACRRS